MSRNEEAIDPDRLVDAADAVLRAIVDLFDADGSYVDPLDLMGTDLEPATLAIYTVDEVREATDFLVRLGVLPAVGSDGHPPEP